MALLPEDENEFRILPAPAALPDCTTWALLPAERVARQYTVELIQLLAPWLDRHDLRRAIDGVATPQWGTPPAWPTHLGAADTSSEEHTSELQSLMRRSYAVFCLKQKTKT